MWLTPYCPRAIDPRRLGLHNGNNILGGPLVAALESCSRRVRKDRSGEVLQGLGNLVNAKELGGFRLISRNSKRRSPFIIDVA